MFESYELSLSVDKKKATVKVTVPKLEKVQLRRIVVDTANVINWLNMQGYKVVEVLKVNTVTNDKEKFRTGTWEFEVVPPKPVVPLIVHKEVVRRPRRLPKSNVEALKQDLEETKQLN